MEEIITILREYTTAPITESSLLADDLGLDSFYILHFLCEVEDHFHITIDPADFESFITVGDVLERIRR